MCTQSSQHGAVRSLKLTSSTAHQIFCPRLFAKNAGVHVTWQTPAVRLYPNWQVQTKVSRTRQYNTSWTFVQRFSGCCRPTNTVPTLLQTLSSNVPKSCNWNKSSYTRWTENRTRTGCSTNLRLELWHLFCASGTSGPVRSGRVMSPSDTFGMRKRIWGFFLAKTGGTFRKCFYCYQHIVTTMYIQTGKIIHHSSLRVYNFMSTVTKASAGPH